MRLIFTTADTENTEGAQKILRLGRYPQSSSELIRADASIVFSFTSVDVASGQLACCKGRAALEFRH